MAISSALIKELREVSGAGMLDCKKALDETNGDIEKAIDLLREKGLSQAAKKSGRIASEGVVEAYIHGGRIGVIVEVNTETDFVAKNEDFRAFVKDVAMQIAASNPKYVSREEVQQDDIEREREVLTQQALNEGKPANIVEKMVEGRRIQTGESSLQEEKKKELIFVPSWLNASVLSFRKISSIW